MRLLSKGLPTKEKKKAEEFARWVLSFSDETVPSIYGNDDGDAMWTRILDDLLIPSELEVFHNLFLQFILLLVPSKNC